MTDNDFEYDDEEEDQSNSIKAMRKQIKAQEKALAELQTLKAENEKLKTSNSLREAGLQLNERQMKALFATHEGDVTPEALKETAADLGFIAAAPRDNDDDVAAQSQFTDVRKGASEVPVAQTYQDELSAAKSRAEAAEIIRKYGGEVVSG